MGWDHALWRVSRQLVCFRKYFVVVFVFPEHTVEKGRKSDRGSPLQTIVLTMHVTFAGMISKVWPSCTVPALILPANTTAVPVPLYVSETLRRNGPSISGFVSGIVSSIEIGATQGRWRRW